MALVSNILTQVFITLIAVAGVYVLTGLTGMFSLGQAAFMAIGSYASGLLVVKAHMPLVPAIIIAVALATLVGYLIGYPVVRLRRDYISLVTLGFGEAIAALLNRMTSLTGGASGFTGIPRKTTLTIAAVSAVLAIALVAFFKSSKYGRQCIALRGDELAAKAMGINVIRIKMTAFLLSVALTAYSGCLYAFYMSYVDPTGFGWKKSADWVIMVFLAASTALQVPRWGRSSLVRCRRSCADCRTTAMSFMRCWCCLSSTSSPRACWANGNLPRVTLPVLHVS